MTETTPERDPARAQSFGAVAETYDAYRPAPPPELAEILPPINGKQVLELAAGTGLLTRFLVARGGEVTAIEPDPRMRHVLVSKTTEEASAFQILEGTAEKMPVASAAFDLACCSSAWHWFRQPDATLEFARVLKSGGTLAVIRNGVDWEAGWAAEILKMRQLAKEQGGDVGGRKEREKVELAGMPFGNVREVRKEWTWQRTPEEIVSWFGTYSGAIVADEEKRQGMRGEIGKLLDRIAGSDGKVLVPMVCRVVLAERLPRSS